jgi:hypothetical protein
MKINEQKSLPRDFAVNSMLNLIEQAQTERRWGKVEVAFQDGKITMIRDERTLLMNR